MSQAYVSKELRDRVAAQARYRCGYCLTAQAIVGTPMEIDHLLPESLGGLTEEIDIVLPLAEIYGRIEFVPEPRDEDEEE